MKRVAHMMALLMVLFSSASCGGDGMFDRPSCTKGDWHETKED